MPELALKPVGRVATSLRKQLKPGRRALVNVWATWCTPCAVEMPELEKLRAPLAARGIDLIGLNVDSDPAADVGGFIKAHRVQYPNYLGGVGAIESLYATDELSVPMSLVINDKGMVTEIIPGWSAETRKRFSVLAGEAEGGSRAGETTGTKMSPRTNRR
jgi:thiol-disulfide isomerase/thioredoxin